MTTEAGTAERILGRLRGYAWGTTGKVPKYLLLKGALVKAIELERGQAGERLPTEAALAHTTPFSLGTVQRAIRALVDDGIVDRRQGYGTFIAAHAREMKSPLQCRFLADDGKSFLPVYPRVLERVRIAQVGPWSAALGQKRDNILRIDRIIDIANRFDVFARFHTRADRFPMLESVSASALDGENLTRLLVGKDTQYDFNQSVLVEPFSEWICHAINLPSGTVGLLLRTLATSSGKPIYFQDLYVPPVRWQLKIS